MEETLDKYRTLIVTIIILTMVSVTVYNYIKYYA